MNDFSNRGREKFLRPFWGLPPETKDALFTTCVDCFGYKESVRTLRPTLEAERAAWQKAKA